MAFSLERIGREKRKGKIGEKKKKHGLHDDENYCLATSHASVLPLFFLLTDFHVRIDCLIWYYKDRLKEIQQVILLA